MAIRKIVIDNVEKIKKYDKESFIPNDIFNQKSKE